VTAGRLRHRVTIQAPPVEGARDPYGVAPRADWTDVATIWAEVRPLRGKEAAVVAQQVAASVTHQVRVRYIDGRAITPRHQLLFEGRILNVNAVIDVEERKRELHILATEAT
jgi:SPP1 family predicted phage head-tail adaptor